MFSLQCKLKCGAPMQITFKIFDTIYQLCFVCVCVCVHVHILYICTHVLSCPPSTPLPSPPQSTRNTVPVPRHWCFKRKYLQGKRGIEKPPFDLPDFIKVGETESKGYFIAVWVLTYYSVFCLTIQRLWVFCPYYSRTLLLVLIIQGLLGFSPYCGYTKI